jgi:hypothetical protein
VSFVFGLMNSVLAGHFRAPHPWHLIEQLSLTSLIYWWYYNDRTVRHYRSSKWLNIGVIALPVVAGPTYLFLSRGAKNGAIASILAVLFLFGLIVLWGIGVAVGEYVA